MKRFYIPTTTLNFNNILSSESVSPKDFYLNRSFGYKRWVTIPENSYSNSIVLYDIFCSFARPKSDYEDHPLLLEICVENDVEDTFLQIGEHTFLSDHTIFLDPFSTRFIFFSETDKNITLSMSEASLETKLVRLYLKKMAIVAPPSISYEIPDEKEQQELNLQEIEKDKCLNRLKGFFYGYYIGALLSTSKENVFRLNTLKQIQNILVAISSSLDHQATHQQVEQLQSLFSSIQPKAPLYDKLFAILKDREILQQVVSVIREEYGFVKGEVNIEHMLSLLLSSPADGEKNPVLESIVKHINAVEAKIKSEATPLYVDSEEIIAGEQILSKLNLKYLTETDKQIYIAWVNEVLSLDKFNGKVSTFKRELADAVTIKAKDLTYETWKGSIYEVTLNRLRRHLAGEVYNYSWDHPILSAISAVILKGDDWQKLLEFMYGKMITDYRLAFALYGTLNGFANLPRDFTDIILSCDRKYVAEVYREFYGQLLGKSLKISKDEVPYDTQNSFRKNEVIESEYIEKSSSGLQNKASESDDFIAFMNNLCEKCKTASKDKNAYKKHYDLHHGFNEDFVKSVIEDSSSFNKGKGIQGTVRKYFTQLLKANKKREKNISHEKSESSVEIHSLFDDTVKSSGLFLADFEFLINNSEFKQSVSNHKDWINDLEWFINAHNPISADYNFYANKPTDNLTVVRQFVNLKKSKYFKAKDFLCKVYHVNF